MIFLKTLLFLALQKSPELAKSRCWRVSIAFCVQAGSYPCRTPPKPKHWHHSTQSYHQRTAVFLSLLFTAFTHWRNRPAGHCACSIFFMQSNSRLAAAVWQCYNFIGRCILAVSPLPTKGVMLYETILSNCNMGNPFATYFTYKSSLTARLAPKRSTINSDWSKGLTAMQRPFVFSLYHTPPRCQALCLQQIIGIPSAIDI